MEITYELSQNDFTEGYRTHRNSKMWWKLLRIVVLVVALFAAVILFGLLIKPSWERARPLMPFFVLVTLWIAALWLLPWWSMRRQFLQQPGAHGPRTLILDDVGAHWKWNGGSSDIEWKNYIRYLDAKKQILFYTSPACFNILPKRALMPEQLNDLRRLLKQYIQIAK